MASFIVRRATSADASALTSCIDAAYSGYLDQGIELPPVSEGISEDITSNIVWVVKQNE